MKQIIKADESSKFGEVRGYETNAARKRAVRNLMRLGYNYFVGFRDVKARFALMFSKVTNSDGTPAAVSVKDCYPTMYGERISCKLCGKRHVLRVAGLGDCPGGY